MTETIRKTLGASLSETASLLLLSTSMVGAIEQQAKFPRRKATALNWS
jgi:DNA-binding transcriptional regulator YiaG